MSGSNWHQWGRHRGIPPGAVRGGYDVDGTEIYVGRVKFRGDTLPAKVMPQKNVAYVSYGGNEEAVDQAEIFCMHTLHWVNCSNGNVPAGAVEAGRTVSGELLYVGRVHHQGSQTIGKVHPSHRTCYIPFGGKELSFQSYEVMVLK